MLCQEYYWAYIHALRDREEELAQTILLEGEVPGQVPLVYLDILSHLAWGHWPTTEQVYTLALFNAAREDHFLILKALLKVTGSPGVIRTAIFRSVEFESASALITLLPHIRPALARSALIQRALDFAQENGKSRSMRILLHAVWNDATTE